MAMLAGPRQKKRYILTPKGKPLFEDNDRFGTKMLEKMGWSKGKGLGKSENGQQDFVRLKFKADDQGFGFQERDDQWTEHEKNFNGLLENLNSGNNSSADNDEMTPAVGLGFATSNTSDKKKKLKEKISGQSLEERSKQSKARVHYKKFTKGKDMSQYSEKDLANIFGKKATPEDANIYDQFQAFNQRDEDVELPPSGTPIINTGISVSDYFKSKMAALKEKQGIEVSLNPFGGNTRIKRKQSDDEEAQEVVEEQVPRKKKKTNPVEVEESESAEPVAESGEEQVPRKKKKSKKQSIEVEESKIVEEAPESEEPPKKKKKDKKKKQELETNVAEEIQNPVESNSEESNSSKKKKKSKKVSCEEVVNEENVETPCIPAKEQIPKTKKKKNKKEIADEPLPEEAKTEKVEEYTSQSIAEEVTSKPIKSKKKKDKAEKNFAI